MLNLIRGQVNCFALPGCTWRISNSNLNSGLSSSCHYLRARPVQKLDRCLTQPVPGQKLPFLHGCDTECLHRKAIWKRGLSPDRVFRHDGIAPMDKAPSRFLNNLRLKGQDPTEILIVSLKQVSRIRVVSSGFPALPPRTRAPLGALLPPPRDAR